MPAWRVPKLLAAALALSCSSGEPAPALPAIDYEAVEARLPARAPRGKLSDRFPDVAFVDQHGETVHFFEDLVRDRAVLVNFMYTQCPKICPGTTANLVRLHEALGDRVGRDITFVSVSLDPEVDTPPVLRRYWEAFGSNPGWLYLRGAYEEVELLRRRLGVYDLDPVVDADKTQHSGIITFGNDRTNRWAALPALSSVIDLAETVTRFTRPPRASGGRAARPTAPVEQSTVYDARGRVRAFPSSREVVIEHEDIPGLMPAMSMKFEVEDPALLAGIALEQRVSFRVVREDRRFRILEIGPRP